MDQEDIDRKRLTWLEHNRFVEYRHSVGCLELRGSGYTPMVLEIVKYMRANLIFISFN